MQKNKFIRIVLILILSVCFLFVSSSSAQNPMFFSQTGHSISGIFLDYYLSIPEVEKLIGYPITDVFISELGNRVQYFNNARLEEDAFGIISLSPIGKLTYSPGNETIQESSFLSCQKLANWEFPVCYDFLGFYYSNGGEPLFGKPISGIEKDHGHIVQYFENMILVWNPDDPDKKIVAGNLGESYFHTKGEDTTLLLPIISEDPSYAVYEIKAQLFIEHALLEPGEIQELYVYVTDQNGIPIEAVNIFSSLHFSKIGTNPQEIPASVTDENGIAIIYFICDQIQKGNIRVIATLNHKNITINTETSFRINY